MRIKLFGMTCSLFIFGFSAQRRKPSVPPNVQNQYSVLGSENKLPC